MIEIPTLHTLHLALRPIVSADAETLYRVYQTEGVLQYFPNPVPPAIEKVERFVIQRLYRKWRNHDTQVLIGQFGLES